MEKISSWFRVILTWVVIIPNLVLSYCALRTPYMELEMASLGLNFLATTVLFYIYMDINIQGKDEEGIEGAVAPTHSMDDDAKGELPLYKMVFGSLIEDMGVWLCLFFILYNIVPLTLFVHSWVGKNI
ncbi:MAG: hypothetical protein PHV68_02810 [Candidatus Gastranaerophilales bacterium]|nr:hypothetical protein [Candidatus Gastranaerophilales bacterium]